MRTLWHDFNSGPRPDGLHLVITGYDIDGNRRKPELPLQIGELIKFGSTKDEVIAFGYIREIVQDGKAARVELTGWAD